MSQLEWVNKLEPEPRFEYKYVLDHHQALDVRWRISTLFTKDSISRAQPRARYFVRSLYFDTDDYTAYAEKMIGETDRNKLRVRTYWRNPEDALFINVEQKRKKARHVYKFVTRINLDEWRYFQRYQKWQTDDANLEEFEFLVRSMRLKPKTLVEYYREAFVARDKSTARLTIDTNLTYADSRCLFEEPNHKKRDLSNKIILEIKTQSDDLPWLNRLIRQLDIGAEPNSKYTDSVEHTQKALWS
jgi:hypothetical protein